ncbi:hypothetical protein LPJ59_004480, partial [Coemansia sp. RSA 2399]
MSGVSNKPLNPRTEHREFFGVPGSVFVMATTVAVVNIWYFSCNAETGCHLPTTHSQWTRIIGGIADYNAYLSATAIRYYVLWWTWLAMLYFAIP